MAVGTFIAGRFSSTYTPSGGAPADMGLTESGYDLSFAYSGELINQTDAYGAMLVDTIYQGLSKVQIGLTGLEYKNGLLAAVTPYGAMTATGATTLSPGVIARLGSAIAGGIILTSTAATPAASTPATLTATYALISDKFDVNWVYNSKLRKISARWDVLGYVDTTVKFLVAT